MSAQTETRRTQDPGEDEVNVEGQGPARSKLVPWLERIIRGPEATDDMKILLFQVAKHGGEQAVDAFYYDRDKAKPIDIVVDDIVKEAVNDARELFGKVKYCVRVEGLSARTTFTLTTPCEDPDEDKFSGESGEQPNVRGLMHLLMRHTEIAMREMVMASRMDRSVLLSVLSEYREEIKGHRKGALEQTIAMGKIMDMSFAREIKIDEHKRKQNRRDWAVKGIIEKGPDVLRALVGGPSVVGADFNGSIEDLADELFSALEETPAAILDLQSKVSGRGRDLFKAMHERIARKRDARRASAAAAGSGSTDPLPTG